MLEFEGQASLLRFLEKQEEMGTETWVLSTTGVDLLERVYQGRFLEPLYFRLASLILRIPPLRDRPADLLPLAQQIAEHIGRRLNLGSVTFAPDAIKRLSLYLWFGNVKELEAVITRTLVIQRKSQIGALDLIWDGPDSRKYRNFWTTRSVLRTRRE